MNHQNESKTSGLSRRETLLLGASAVASMALSPVAPSDKPEPTVATPGPAVYAEKKFELGKLTGLSDKQLEAHLGLYAGYVKNTNLILEQMAQARTTGRMAEPTVAELRRRLGFEFSGMRLHELYFSALGAARAKPNPKSSLGVAIEKQFGSFALWAAELKAVGMMRGIGWAMLVRDNVTGALINTWVEDHQNGTLPGLTPIVVMDVWEHAYTVDYKPSQRKDYIEAYFANLDWSVIEKRA